MITFFHSQHAFLVKTQLYIVCNKDFYVLVQARLFQCESLCLFYILHIRFSDNSHNKQNIRTVCLKANVVAGKPLANQNS